jgi:hypothetical protein
VDENEPKPISFRASGEEVEAIDRAADEHGLSRAEYIRQRLLNPTPIATGNSKDSPLAENPITLLKEVLFGLQRISKAVYLLAEFSGAFSDEQLDEAEAKSLEQAIIYLKGLGASIAKHQKQIAFEKASE